jgi:hypothetical protein
MFHSLGQIGMHDGLPRLASYQRHDDGDLEESCHMVAIPSLWDVDAYPALPMTRNHVDDDDAAGDDAKDDGGIPPLTPLH